MREEKWLVKEIILSNMWIIDLMLLLGRVLKIFSERQMLWSFQDSNDNFPTILAPQIKFCEEKVNVFVGTPKTQRVMFHVRKNRPEFALKIKNVIFWWNFIRSQNGEFLSYNAPKGLIRKHFVHIFQKRYNLWKFRCFSR